MPTGPVAQRIRHLTTNQGIAGSSPARVKVFFLKCQRQYNVENNNCIELHYIKYNCPALPCVAFPHNVKDSMTAA